MRRGYTLAELMIAMFLGSLLLLAAVRVLHYSADAFTRVQAHSMVQSQGQLAVRRFSEELRLANVRNFSIVTTGLTASPDTIPLAVAFRPKATDGTGMAPKDWSPGPAYVIYYFDQTKSQWLRGVWTYPTPFTADGNDEDYRLTATDLSGILSVPATPTGLDAPPQVLTQYVSAVGVTPAPWPAAPFDLSRGVQLSITVHYDYLSGAASAGLQSLNGGFTSTFVTNVMPRNQ